MSNYPYLTIGSRLLGQASAVVEKAKTLDSLMVAMRELENAPAVVREEILHRISDNLDFLKDVLSDDAE